MTVNVELQISQIIDQLDSNQRQQLAAQLFEDQKPEAATILMMIKELSKEERGKLIYQLRKEEGLEEFSQLMDEIASETDPKYLPSEDEIINAVSEVREELYQKRKKKG